MTDLHTTLQRRTEARERLTTATDALERGRKLAAERSALVEQHAKAFRASTTEHADALTQWARSGMAGTPPATLVDTAAATECMRSEYEAGAAMQALAQLTAAHNAIALDLQRAEVAVQFALSAHVSAQIRTQFDEYARVLADLKTRRLRLLGAYLVQPSALSDREWHEVDARSIVSAQTMNVGLPIVGYSMYSSSEM